MVVVWKDGGGCLEGWWWLFRRMVVVVWKDGGGCLEGWWWLFGRMVAVVWKNGVNGWKPFDRACKSARVDQILTSTLWW